MTPDQRKYLIKLIEGDLAFRRFLKRDTWDDVILKKDEAHIKFANQLIKELKAN